MNKTFKNPFSDTLSPSMSLLEVRNAFTEKNVSHLPVVKKGVFLGTLSLEIANELEAEFLLENYTSYLDPVFVNKTAHWMEVLQQMLKHSCNCIPVLDDRGKFIQTYKLQDVMDALSASDFINHQGTTLILKAATNEFNVSKLSRIIEAHGGAVLGFLIEEQNEENTVICMKLQTQDFNNTCKSLRRYGYQLMSPTSLDDHHSDFAERIDYVKKYMLT